MIKIWILKWVVVTILVLGPDQEWNGVEKVYEDYWGNRYVELCDSMRMEIRSEKMVREMFKNLKYRERWYDEEADYMIRRVRMDSLIVDQNNY